MVATAKNAWFALMNWKTRMGSPRSPVRTRPLPLPRYRAPGAVAGSHAADVSAPHARRWSGRPVGGRHRDRPVTPSSRSPGRSVRTRATALPGFAQIGPDQPSVAGKVSTKPGQFQGTVLGVNCRLETVNNSNIVNQRCRRMRRTMATPFGVILRYQLIMACSLPGIP